MKILPIKNISKIAKLTMLATPLILAPFTNKTSAQQKDVFIKSEEIIEDDSLHFSPKLRVANEDIYPAIVVDISENQLYAYDLGGELVDVYPVATGKASTPTKVGLRIVTAIENYPYKEASPKTKRYNNPGEYGPNVICLAPVDIETGDILAYDGQFLHGTNKPESIGKSASKGCIRMHNDAITTLAENLSKGQYILIKD